MIIVAALLIPRFGSALITGFIGAMVGVGTMALMAAIVIELVFWALRAASSCTGRAVAVGSRTTLWWAIVAGIAVGVMSYGIMFTVKEFLALSGGLMGVALLARMATGALFGWLAWLIVVGLLRAGFTAQSRGGRRGPGRAEAEPRVLSEEER